MKYVITILLILSSKILLADSDVALSKCPKDLKPIKEIDLVWPGLPAGGEHLVKDGYVVITFTVNPDGKTTDSKSIEPNNDRRYFRVGLHTIAKIKYPPRKEACRHKLRLDFNWDEY